MPSRDDLLPFLVTLLGVAVYSLMDGYMKSASLAVGVFSAMLIRSFIGGAMAATAWRMRGWRPPGVEAMRVHLLRGAVGTGMALTFFYGLTLLPMAEAIAISFVAPLFALYLAAVLLGERIGAKAMAASLMGLAGVAVIAFARIDGAGDQSRAILGVVSTIISALLFAWNLILGRKQALLAGPLEVATVHNLVVGCLLLLGAPWLLVWPEPRVLADIAVAAFLATSAAALYAWAYARAEAQALVPLEYSAFLWAALFGWLFFRETLTLPTVAGAVLIVAGCWIAAPRKRTEPAQV
jgi:S-adenosylmethionine uptake transporter